MKNVVIYLFDGVQLTDFAVPADALDVANQLLKKEFYKISYCSTPPSSLVKASANMQIKTRFWPESKPVDLLIFPGAHPTVIKSTLAIKKSSIDMKRLASLSSEYCSICTGSFFMADLGLLQGKAATTHWMEQKRLQDEFPDILVKDDILFTHDENVWTSAGMMSGLDMILAIIGRDHGTKFALQVARTMVVYLMQQGGQAQFSMPMNYRQQARDNGLISLIAWLEENLSNSISVEDMASHCNMSKRTLQRSCAKAFDMNPSQLFMELRLEHARLELESDQYAIKQIAVKVGFQHTPAFSRAFSRRFSVSPSTYREHFLSSLSQM